MPFICMCLCPAVGAAAARYGASLCVWGRPSSVARLRLIAGRRRGHQMRLVALHRQRLMNGDERRQTRTVTAHRTKIHRPEQQIVPAVAGAATRWWPDLQSPAGAIISGAASPPSRRAPPPDGIDSHSANTAAADRPVRQKPTECRAGPSYVPVKSGNCGSGGGSGQVIDAPRDTGPNRAGPVGSARRRRPRRVACGRPTVAVTRR